VLFLLVVVAVVAVRALAPPHPDFFSDFESVHEMRRRLNITYGYTTKHLHSEQCRHLSEEDCERYDTHFGEERERRRRLVRDPARRHLNPATGEWRGLVLLARFPEHAGKDLAPKSYVEEMFNGRGTSAVNLAGSVSEFYYYHSLKQLTITWDVIDWDTAPRGERYYSHDVGGKAGPEVMQELLSWKLEKLDLEGFDFSPYDKDMDFVLDHLVVLHSGISAEMGNIPCGEKYLERIWSQGTPAMAAIPYVTPTSLYSIGGYAIGSAIGVVGNCEGDPYWDMGITAHEIGHTFYLVDTYDDDASEGYVKIGGLANHDIMANAYGWNRDPFFPSHMSPFSREAAGWLTPIEITKSGLYAAQSAQISGSVYRIRHGFPDGEYLLIENRQIIKWDADRPDGASGFVIFHVDEKANGMKERSWPGKEGWPKEHYMVRILESPFLQPSRYKVSHRSL
jgi:M6 family metalloprotease-like protein